MKAVLKLTASSAIIEQWKKGEISADEVIGYLEELWQKKPVERRYPTSEEVKKIGEYLDLVNSLDADTISKLAEFGRKRK